MRRNIRKPSFLKFPGIVAATDGRRGLKADGLTGLIGCGKVNWVPVPPSSISAMPATRPDRLMLAGDIFPPTTRLASTCRQNALKEGDRGNRRKLFSSVSMPMRKVIDSDVDVVCSGLRLPARAASSSSKKACKHVFLENLCGRSGRSPVDSRAKIA